MKIRYLITASAVVLAPAAIAQTNDGSTPTNWTQDSSDNSTKTTTASYTFTDSSSRSTDNSDNSSWTKDNSDSSSASGAQVAANNGSTSLRIPFSFNLF